jgi:CxxC-x17-CxxC domain-containing protein
MHQATCAECGNSCEVPFRPVDGRPVYCANCFQSKRETGGDRGGDRFPRRDFGANKTFIKPAFSGNAGQGGNDELKKQLEMLNTKMDRLIKAVEAMAYTKPLMAEKNIKEAPQQAVREAPKGIIKETPVAEVKKTAKKVSKKKKK